MCRWFVTITVTMLVISGAPAAAQTPTSAPSTTAQDPHAQHAQHEPAAWHVMQDGVLFLNFNRQGGPRGDTEFRSQNWWMGMASRDAGPGRLTLSAMLSLEPATVGAGGYSEIFQSGEAHEGKPIVDRQHPHDFVMQLGASWRIPLNADTGLTLVAAPIGEPAMGPVAFMHRPSAAENPTAPLGHHTLDSTHIAMGVITAAVDRGPWQFETSIFQGREPDDNRWDLMDPGALDSWSARAWYRPSSEWAFQISHGFLHEPEELEEGDVRRTTLSASWTRQIGDTFTAVAAIYGRNDKHDESQNAFLTEATHRIGLTSLYGRLEVLQVETDVLRFGVHLPAHDDDQADEGGRTMTALTLGGVRDIWQWNGYGVGVGADLTLYRVPSVLEETHGSSPVSFHLFLRARPPASMGRMWNMIMSRPHQSPSEVPRTRS